jgi:TPP-dependent indolepyruvate ferredoxin oxidoreductase alpha subunit
MSCSGKLRVKTWAVVQDRIPRHMRDIIHLTDYDAKTEVLLMTQHTQRRCLGRQIELLSGYFGSCSSSLKTTLKGEPDRCAYKS